MWLSNIFLVNYIEYSEKMYKKITNIDANFSTGDLQAEFKKFIATKQLSTMFSTKTQNPGGSNGTT